MAACRCLFRRTHPIRCCTLSLVFRFFGRDEVFTALDVATAMISHADRILMPYEPYMDIC